jgi:hypothetical protein
VLCYGYRLYIGICIYRYRYRAVCECVVSRRWLPCLSSYTATATATSTTTITTGATVTVRHSQRCSGVSAVRAGCDALCYAVLLCPLVTYCKAAYIWRHAYELFSKAKA